MDGGSYSLSYDVKDIQATADYVVSEFLEDGGKALVPEHELARAKALMKGNNYTHLYYTESGKVGAYERFNENYYLLSCGSELLSQGLIPTGMVGVNNKKDPATGKTLNGCYLATPSSGDAAGRDDGAERAVSSGRIALCESVGFEDEESNAVFGQEGIDSGDESAFG